MATPTVLDTPCLPWWGTLMNKGYGTTWDRAERREVLAHRFVYEQAFGSIPDGLFVLHRCDNPPCVNPEHLFLGDTRDNAIDMVRKGRHRGGARRGEANHFAKLTDAQVAVLRADRTAGMTQRALARKYGVGQSQVWRILRGESRS
jgi:hypothetical protein